MYTKTRRDFPYLKSISTIYIKQEKKNNIPVKTSCNSNQFHLTHHTKYLYKYQLDFLFPRIPFFSSLFTMVESVLHSKIITEFFLLIFFCPVDKCHVPKSYT